MGILPVLFSSHHFLKLVVDADRYFRKQRPDAVVLIDFPGFNWWIARRAHARGIPVFYFVPPQLWAWAGWRVKKMQRWIDHVLCTLPFEQAWYQERGVAARYVGHPYFDELPRQRLDADFIRSQQKRSGRIIGLLPGSRSQEIRHNLSTLMRTATMIHESQPDTRFLVACYKPGHREMVTAYLAEHPAPFVEPCTGCTPEIMHLAHACIAVSGSVGLELLYRGKPAVVVYRVDAFSLKVLHGILNSRYISLVNLLAGKELFPEYLTDKCEASAVSAHVLRWLTDPSDYQQIVTEMSALRDSVAEPGACERAAHYVMDVLGRRQMPRKSEAA
jgi:lipid-A-disaccharide synthase